MLPGACRLSLFACIHNRILFLFCFVLFLRCCGGCTSATAYERKNLTDVRGFLIVKTLLLGLIGISATQKIRILIFINHPAFTSKKIKAPNVQSGNEGKKTNKQKLICKGQKVQLNGCFPLTGLAVAEWHRTTCRPVMPSMNP